MAEARHVVVYTACVAAFWCLDLTLKQNIGAMLLVYAGTHYINTVWRIIARR
jgi:hypothetical protein